MTKIFGGCPIKIFAEGIVYLPKSYWQYFGINPQKDKIIREDREKSVVFHPYELRHLKDNESVKKVYFGRVHIHHMWMILNHIKTGDTLWLAGTEEGLVLAAYQSVFSSDKL